MQRNLIDGPLAASNLTMLGIPALDADHVRYRAQRGRVLAEVKVARFSFTVFTWIIAPDRTGAWTRRPAI